jgi:hypothetical protein
MVTTRKGATKVKKSKTIHKGRTVTDQEIPDVRSKGRRVSKQTMLIKLLELPGGATIDEMVKKTGWQRHSIRGLISGVFKKRLGRSVTSEKGEGGRIYRMAAL